MNRRSFVGLIQAGVENVLSVLRRSRLRFICCALARRSSQQMSPHNGPSAEQPIDVPLLRSQVYIQYSKFNYNEDQIIMLFVSYSSEDSNC